MKYRVNHPKGGKANICRAEKKAYCFGGREEPSESEKVAYKHLVIHEGRKLVASQKNSSLNSKFTKLGFPVYEVQGGQLLSQSGVGNILRQQSDSYNATNFTVAEGEAVGISYFDGKCACGKVLFTLDASYKWRLNEAEADPAYDNQVQNTDHIVPASVGHLAAAGNLQPLCAQCNQTRKSERTKNTYSPW